MPRPRKCRRLQHGTPCRFYKPNGISASALEAVALAADEFEALALADFRGLAQQEAAEQMGISRQTFGNLIKQARHKLAKALIEGQMLELPHTEEQR
ncbi:DUF134 domain-containing protein [Shewanella algae]|uniref:DUF134 domain-containing protein n=1 Tax=Shewanella algae TaxID=38313 RepID=UPI0031F4C9ED